MPGTLSIGESSLTMRAKYHFSCRVFMEPLAVFGSFLVCDFLLVHTLPHCYGPCMCIDRRVDYYLPVGTFIDSRYCSLCDLWLNGLTEFEWHVRWGMKHEKRLIKMEVEVPPERI